MMSGIGDPARHKAMAEALADPVRGKIFLATADPLFVERDTDDDDSVGISIRQISERVQEPRRRVRHHVGVLCRQGLTELVAEKRQQGVIEHYYRAACLPMLTEAQMEALPVAQQQKIILELLKDIFADSTAALESGSFVRRPEWAAARLFADVDEQGWMELAAIFEKTTREALEVIAEARERPRLGDQQPIRVGAALLLFEASSRKAAKR